jgi:hypothetical protein
LTGERPEVLGRELGRERLDPQALGQIGLARPLPGCQMTRPEPSRIDVDQAVAVVELEPDPRVGRVSLWVKEQRAGHPQVHQQVTIS